MNHTNIVKLNKIEIKNKNTIIYRFNCDKKLENYFLKNNFQIKYQFSLINIPKSILVIPFISNILPLIWINNATLKIDELDKNFYKCIPKIKKGYQKMMPNIKLKGKIIVKNIIDNQKENFKSKRKIVFFSGGVDSTSSLINHIKENIETFTIWGSDISYENDFGWNNIKNHVEKITKKLNLNANYCKSNFRDIINYEEINKKIEPIIHDNYWHAYQHSIAIISHAVPYAYKNNISTIYFPATLSPKYRKRTCASIPTVDNNFCFANTKTIHDGYDYTRLDKIKIITNFNNTNKEKIELRVCWQSLNGKNCTHCEKCFRTILELLSINANPSDYNFDIIQSTYDLIKYDITHLNQNETIKYKDYYNEIIKEVQKKDIHDLKNNIKWILEINKF